MRVAVTAKEASVDGPVDPRFGRARYLLVVDTETGETDVHDNEVNLNAAQGAGIQTAGNLAQLNVSAVITGHAGPNAFRALSASGIAVYTGAEGTVAEAVESFNNGKLVEAKSADVEGHWL